MEMPNFTYDKIVPFHNNENYTIAIANGKAGLIDLEGNPITEFIYDINKHENDEFFHQKGSDSAGIKLDHLGKKLARGSCFGLEHHRSVG